MDSAKAERPERRTALVARELDRYNIQIAALSETRFANEGQLTEVNAGYTFFWSGRSSEERREAGVGFAIKSNLISRLTNLPKGVNDRLMTLRLPMKGKCQATFISAYAPTMTNPEEVKDKFYEDLEALIMDVPKGDKLVILGDFNARVGTDYQTWEGVLGRNGIGKCNSNGHLLLKTCATHDLQTLAPHRLRDSPEKGQAGCQSNKVYVRCRLLDRPQALWEKEEIPQEFKDASIVHLYKRKGNRQSCDNHRGISLLVIAGKILARVLLNRLIQHMDDHLPESQCGFREGRGTADMIFAARQLQEKCQEQNRDLYTTFVDLTKAFDTVNRNGLWRIMGKFGCPSKFINMVRQFHDGMQARVLDAGDSSSAFAVTNGVKQGCVLAPTLFSMMFTAMLSNAFREDDATSIKIRYRTDGRLFNLRRLKAKTKVKVTSVRDFLFADDSALNAASEDLMQQSMDRFSSAADNFGLTISTKKTEVLYQPAPQKPYVDPVITVNGEPLKVVAKFKYLGSTLSRSVNIDDEVDARVALASSSFGRLRASVWERRGIRLSTKLKVYRAVVLPSLLYACETWTIYARHARKLNRFHINCLKRLMKITWQDKVPDTEILQRADLPSIHTLLRKAQVRWAGHLVRMPDTRLPKRLLYSELAEGKRSVGGQKKRFKDTLKSSFKSFKIDTSTWESTAHNRAAWRSHISSGATLYEQSRIAEAVRKRASRAAPTSRTPETHLCPTCGRTFRARIGLVSHSRTHKT
ncbi:hypothetical protein Bbelb_297760 [Branchiostoma belcheri]|nr:hypothetical protein Bbelb_297760 [Branchiostoma belcheri]